MYQQINGTLVRHCYLQSILEVYANQKISIKVVLVSSLGYLHNSDFDWKVDITSLPFKEGVFEVINTYGKQQNALTNYEFNRMCSFEFLSHSWKPFSLCNRKSVEMELKNAFASCFEIIELKYDISRQFIYRLKLKATNLGITRKSKYFNFEIGVVLNHSELLKEVGTVSSLNIVRKPISIELNSYLLVYITDQIEFN